MNTVTLNDRIKIELKNFKYFPSGSQETNCFTADVYADGQLIGYAHNQGCGGNTNISAGTPEMRQKMNDVDAYLRTLPPTPYNVGGHEGEMDSNLENVVDDLCDKLIEEKEIAKFRKKMEKTMLICLVMGKADGSEYGTWRYKRPLADILATDKGKEVITQHLLDHVAKGEINTTDKCLLNTNIPADIMALVQEALVKKG